MLNGFPFLNQSLSPTQSLTFRFMGTVGNLNIKAAAVIDSCLLIFQSGPVLLHHRQSLLLYRQLHVKDEAVNLISRHLRLNVIFAAVSREVRRSQTQTRLQRTVTMCHIIFCTHTQALFCSDFAFLHIHVFNTI